MSTAAKIPASPKKKGKGCGCAIAVVVLLLLVGGVLASVRFGMLKLPVNIPGITPSGRPSPPLYGEGADMYAPDAAVEAPEDTEPAAPAPEPEPTLPERAQAAPTVVDEEQGARRLARTWNAMKPEDLVRLVERGWTDEELARVLLHMDPQNVARLLSAMDPEQASRVSRELQAQASVVRPEVEP